MPIFLAGLASGYCILYMYIDSHHYVDNELVKNSNELPKDNVMPSSIASKGNISRP